MTVCVVPTSLDSQWFYPVLDPYRVAGTGPWNFGYVFAWDGAVITVERNPALSRCQMGIALSTDPVDSETKEIGAWNFFSDTFVDRIGTAPLTSRLPWSLKKGAAPSEGHRNGRVCW